MTMRPINYKNADTHPFIKRAINLSGLVREKSHFLFGPRQTGKTFLISHVLKGVPVYNLLDTKTFLQLNQNPGRIAEEITQNDKVVVIDEIQRLPELLNEIHLLIEKRRINFLLTGSSARKLRRGGVNLLGGRARTIYLHPFTSKELGAEFNLNSALNRGLLPPIYFSDNPDADLTAYTGTYLQEEIVAEGAARNVPAFSRFLKVAAFCNGTIVNFTNVANDAQVARTTVYEYFDILKDTLVIRELPAWKKTKKRKPLSSSKYYFFDTGVVRSLQGRIYTPGTPEFGEAFETFIFHELICYSNYYSNEPLFHWRSTSGFEVDFIIGDHTAIEVKAKENISTNDLKPLNALSEENKLKNYICVSFEPRPRKIGNIIVLPYKDFLSLLWDGKYR